MNNTSMPGKVEWSDYCLILLTGLLWGSAFLLIKIAIVTIPPYTLTMGRMGIATLALFVVLIVRGESLPLDRKSLALFAFIGLFGSALPFTLINWGEIHIPSGLAAVLMGIMPITTALLAHFFIPDEPFGWRKAIGIFVGFGGLLVLVGIDAISGFDSSVTAQIAMLCAAAAYAITTTFTRLRVAHPGLIMATGSSMMGFLWALPLALVYDRPWSLTPDLMGVSATVLLGLLPSAVGILLFFHLIRRVGATIFAQVNYLIPLVGAFLGAVFLGEALNWQLISALVLVLSGISIVTLAR
jgi:drug/metabolite transporter (DMT)-like permease